jgi:hypothetical protein
VSLAETGSIAALAVGAVAIIAAFSIRDARRRALVTGVLTALCGLSGLLAAIGVLATGRPVRAELPHLLPFAGLSFRLDPLGALFVLAVGGVVIAAAVYGIGYTRDHLSSRSFQALVPARFLIRGQEIEASVELLEWLLETLAQLGDAPTLATIEPPSTPCSGVGIVEAWRGTLVHRIELAPDGTLMRVKVVDPSFFNWPALAPSLNDTIVPDFPLVNKSFNLSYAGNDL